MLELTSAGVPVHLSPGTSVQLERNSPLFDEETIKGEFAYSFTVPAGPNGRLYDFPERPDAAGAPGAPRPAELGLDGVPLLRGTQRIKTASPAKYSVALAGGLSGAGLSERLLSSFRYGGLREVPRWVTLPPDANGLSQQAPGLPLHANEVVAHPAAYPYVFAPLRNEYLNPDQPLYYTPEVLYYPRLTVNGWEVSPIGSAGMPAGGCFTYNTQYGPGYVPGQIELEPFELLPPYCPFPRLRYVLQAICEESGLAVDTAQLLPGELGELVFVGPAQLLDRGDADMLRFSLADVLPEMTVAALLAALRQDLGVVVYVDPATGWVRSGLLAERLAPGATEQDLSAYAAGYAEVTPGEPVGRTLTYQVDAGDELDADLLTRQPAAGQVLPAVETVGDLPARAVLLRENPQTGQVRLVRSLNTYYACTVQPFDGVQVLLSWAELVLALPPVLVDGGGEAQAQTLCYTRVRPTRVGLTLLGNLWGQVPSLCQPPYRADQDVVPRSPALRLLFYRGLQLASDGTSRYPQLAAESPSRTYSLYPDGVQGTYAQLLRAWLAAYQGPSYKQSLALPALALARLDLSRPVRLDGVRYLVRKLSATVPLRKPATAELVRI